VPSLAMKQASIESSGRRPNPKAVVSATPVVNSTARARIRTTFFQRFVAIVSLVDGAMGSRAVLGLCHQLDDDLLAFAIVELWIVALVDGRA
jgi:hypothetical protein